MLRPDEVLDRAGVHIPAEGPYETVAGFVMSQLGRLPAVGDRIAVEGGSLRVERLDGRRIDRLRFTPDPEAVPEGIPDPLADVAHGHRGRKEADDE